MSRYFWPPFCILTFLGPFIRVLRCFSHLVLISRRYWHARHWSKTFETNIFAKSKPFLIKRINTLIRKINLARDKKNWDTNLVTLTPLWVKTFFYLCSISSSYFYLSKSSQGILYYPGKLIFLWYNTPSSQPTPRRVYWYIIYYYYFYLVHIIWNLQGLRLQSTFFHT